MKKKNDDFDLESCFDMDVPVPDEYLDPDERKPTLEERSYYATDEDGAQYYYCGDTCIHITEHFAEKGKTVGELMEDLLLRKAKNATNDNALNR